MAATVSRWQSALPKRHDHHKLMTLIFVRRGDSVLLGMKKRGFGTGKFNGFGGKVEAGETIEQGALRELQEESALEARSLTSHGCITFSFTSRPEFMEVHIFSTFDYDGEPAESDEMRPQWFPLAEVPRADMWADDEHWLPVAFQGAENHRVLGHFSFGDEATIESFDLNDAGLALGPVSAEEIRAQVGPSPTASPSEEEGA